jgi:thioredoxin 1
MKMSRAVCFIALLLAQTVAFAHPRSNPRLAQRAAVARESSSFEPLNRWKAAVLAGNESALAALYSTHPPARVQTPQGAVEDPEAEPRFWSALAANGLSKVEPKVLDIDHLQAGAVSLVLRIEITARTHAGEEPFVVSAGQVWAQQQGQWRILISQRSQMVANPGRRLPEPAQPNTDLYASPEQARAEILSALATAAKDHKRVILVFGANWCYDCHVLDAAFHSKSIAPLVDANYHVVHVNIGEQEDKNLDLASKYQVPLNRGVPALAVLDADGKIIYSQKQGEFENSVRIGPADVVEFLKKWAPTNPG